MTTTSSPSVAWRRLRAALIALYVVQTAVTLGAYFHLHRQDAPGALRIYGEATPVTGAASPVLVTALDRATGRLIPADVTLSLAGEAIALNPTEAGARGEVPGLSDASALSVVTLGAATGDRALQVALRPYPVAAGWDAPSAVNAGSTPRRPELATADDEPRVWVRPAEDDCTDRLTIAANGGVVARDVDNRLHLRLTDAAGVSRRGVAIALTPREPGDPRPEVALRTDRLGVAAWEGVRIAAPESWIAAFECSDGTAATRRVSIIPSWDGIVLQLPSPVVPAGTTPRLVVGHQRNWGAWFADLWCDERWVSSEVGEVVAGMQRVVLSSPVPDVSEPTWCRLSGTTRLHAADPPRSVLNAIVAPASMSEREAIVAVARTVAAVHASPESAQLTALSLSGLSDADDASVRRFGFWLLDRLPHRFRPPPVLLDDAAGSAEAFAARRGGQLGRLLVALALDALLLLVVVVGVLAPAAMRQRARLQQAWEDPEDADAHLEASRSLGRVDRPMWIGGLGLALILATILALSALLSALR